MAVARSVRIVAAVALSPGCELRADVGWECPGVVINEFSTKNQHWVVDEAFGGEPDWIELFNPTEHRVDLTGFRLVQGSDFDTGTFPELVPPSRYSAGPMLEPGAFLLVLADKSYGLDDEIRLAFALSREASDLALYGPVEHGSVPCDHVEYPTQHSDWSYARYPDAADDWRIAVPTPGRTNEAPEAP